MDGSAADGEPIYILITQCLQNDFLLNMNCRLHLPEEAAGKLLIHPLSEHGFDERKSRRIIDSATMRAGPLGRFLRATAERRRKGYGRGTLHLVNVRDWHTTSEDYDIERRRYGQHCEAGSWGADYPSGLTKLLDPTGSRRRIGDPEGGRCNTGPEGSRSGSLVVHHVHSNTLFDLEPGPDGGPSELTQVLDGIITDETRARVHVAVIGVYTDIKVQIILQSLRVAYRPQRLVVSDSLTASPTLERHLAALDFADKVLAVEVMHGVADLARFLGADLEPDEELESSAAEIAFADYAQYFADKQCILSGQDAQLREYRRQTTRGLHRAVRLVNATSVFLVCCGALTLGTAVVLTVIAAWGHGIPVALPAVLMGLSVVQLVSTFFTRPVDAVTTMLGREALFRMLLESRSLRLALAKYHLTTPDALRNATGSQERGDWIQRQLEVLATLDREDFERFERFGPGIGTRPAPSTAERESVDRVPPTDPPSGDASQQ